MKKRISSFSGTRTASLSDLITHSQDAISAVSSQATVISTQSQQIGSLRTQQYQNFQEYQEGFIEESQTLRISPEEQRKIQEVLQLARKGKINAANAFSVPVKVADPQIAQGHNMRFWKFASELLYASMGIYDKRVENVFQNTHRMFDSLVRVTNNQIPVDAEQETKKQRGQLINLNIVDLQHSSSIASFDFQKYHSEQPQKINLKKSLLNYIPDPLFNKKLQAFDSDTLKSLFLNIFETNEQGEIIFFNNEKKKKKQSKLKLHIVQQTHQQDITQSQTQTQAYQQKGQSQQLRSHKNISYNIFEELDNMNINFSNQICFTKITQFKNQNLKQPISDNLVQDFLEQLTSDDIQDLQNHDSVIKTFIQPIFSDPYESQIQSNGSSHNFGQISIKTQSVLTKSQYNYQINPFISDNQTSDQPFSVMTPWQLEFRNNKIHRKRKKNNKVDKQLKKQNIPISQNKMDLQINFLSYQNLIKKQIFQKTKDKQLFQDEKIIQKYLLPKNILSRQIYRNDLKQRQKYSSQKLLLNFGRQRPSQGPINVHTQYNLDNTATYSKETQSNDDNQYEAPYNRQFQYSYNKNLRNIREVKHNIYQNLVHQKSLKISDIELGLTPASALVVLLHLANQRNLVLNSFDQFSNIQITFQK